MMRLLDKILNKKKADAVELDLFAAFLKKYPPCGKLQKPEPEFLAMAAKIVPAELIAFWQQYGFGSYGDGIIKVVNPTDYMGSLYMWLGKEDFSKIPIMVTAFGDIIYYRRLSETEDDICMLNVHYRKIEVLAYSFNDFWERTTNDEAIMSPLLHSDMYGQAVREKGTLQDGEIFYFVPALVLGGAISVKNVDKGDAVVHLQLLFEMGNKENVNILQYLNKEIAGKESLEGLVNAFEKMSKIRIDGVEDEQDMILFETGTYSFSGEPLFYFSLVRQFPNGEEEFYQVHLDIQYRPSEKNEMYSEAVWNIDIEEDIFSYIKKAEAYLLLMHEPIEKIETYIDET